jgi:hypothetical protein
MLACWHAGMFACYRPAAQACVCRGGRGRCSCQHAGTSTGAGGIFDSGSGQGRGRGPAGDPIRRACRHDRFPPTWRMRAYATGNPNGGRASMLARRHDHRCLERPSAGHQAGAGDAASPENPITPAGRRRNSPSNRPAAHHPIASTHDPSAASSRAPNAAPPRPHRRARHAPRLPRPPSPTCEPNPHSRPWRKPLQPPPQPSQSPTILHPQRIPPAATPARPLAGMRT